MVAVNSALVAEAGIVTLAGTFTAELLLWRVTFTPLPGAALPSETVHVSVPEPAKEASVQVNPLSEPLEFS